MSVYAPLDAAHAKADKILYAFTGGSDGNLPYAGVVADSAGNLYGTTCCGGSGTVFKITPGGTKTTVYAFSGGADGANPAGGLVMDKAGNLYGTTFNGGQARFGVVFKVAPNGTETVLHTFTGSSDGANPYTGLVRDKKGNLYGTTQKGGSSNKGTVFKVATDGTESVLHAFSGGSDGALPVAGLLMDKSGSLYGTTVQGGGTGCIGNAGCGTAYMIAGDGTESIVHAFTGGSDGELPYAGLTADSVGNLYGTAVAGGGGACNVNGIAGCGVIFKLAPDGTETVLYAFRGGSDGLYPYAGLTRNRAGKLYGTTYYGGGSGCGGSGCGTVFQLAAGGTETVLHAFAGGTDGAQPYLERLIEDSAGNFYGTTYYGGDTGCNGGNGCGTVFKIK